ncbi:hypothetical protein ONS95_005074 [Cadophora gregata]|uniref:uncharacterized protein n=1 Tax=Cadophora gregata TaxID=51156 RepID=UPI0026DBF3AA|nr:uncharacterized protein ONS95_005074 [Cadophora gregata]KAK0104806.1 hypothetical protein ONS95_005074 [Cadophora gregata]KAK0115110.1 hypothetical protein ONS96_013580 [Cadophora gregata f. sp. sojae]
MSEHSDNTGTWANLSDNKTPAKSDTGTFKEEIIAKHTTHVKGAIRVADVRVRFKFATFPRVPVKDNFTLDQEPCDWHRIFQFGYWEEAKRDITHSLYVFAKSENGASKLVLAIIFSEVYKKIRPVFWEKVRLSATEILFCFVNAPDKYTCTISGIKYCDKNTLITSTSVENDGTVTYSVTKDGEVRYTDTLDHMWSLSPEQMFLGTLPELTVSVL